MHEHEGPVQRRRHDRHQCAVQRAEVGNREVAEALDGGGGRQAHPVLVGRRRQRERRPQVAHHPGEHAGIRPGLEAAEPAGENDDGGHDGDDPERHPPPHGRKLATPASVRRGARASLVGMPERPPTGLIIGRFDPPHLGHSFLIEQAAAQCERLVVYVNSSAARDAAPGALRARGWPSCTPTSPSSRSSTTCRPIGRRGAVGALDRAVPRALAPRDGARRRVLERPLCRGTGPAPGRRASRGRC